MKLAQQTKEFPFMKTERPCFSDYNDNHKLEGKSSPEGDDESDINNAPPAAASTEFHK